MLQYLTPNDYFDLRASKAIAAVFSAGPLWGPIKWRPLGWSLVSLCVKTALCVREVRGLCWNDGAAGHPSSNSVCDHQTLPTARRRCSSPSWKAKQRRGCGNDRPRIVSVTEELPEHTLVLINTELCRRLQHKPCDFVNARHIHNLRMQCQ